MLNELQIPIPSIWDWYTYLHEWLMFMVNVGESAIHGWHGLYTDQIGFTSFNPGSTIQKHPVGIWHLAKIKMMSSKCLLGPSVF